MPDEDDKDKLADEFADYFLGKIQKIRDQLDHYDKYSPLNKDLPRMSSFKPVSKEEVSKLVKAMATKSCETDAISTKLLKKILPSITGSITNIINLSLEQGVFAKNWKTAIVRPLLKKLGLDLIPPNYRPVSNLLFLPKHLEKCALQQFNDHCAKYDLMPDYQSRYCTNYSNKTSLVKLTNDLLWGMEYQEVMTLTVLDLSAAFLTADHQIL